MARVRPSLSHERLSSRGQAFRGPLLALASMALMLTLTGCPDDMGATSQAPGHAPTNATAPPAKTAPAPAVPASPTPSPQAPAPDQSVADQQHAQKVQDLVNRAQSSYKSGVSNYNANHLDAARQDFDYAVDTMLSSGMDLKNDPALSDEFDRLLSAINSLEMVALQQGNGFSPKVEAAPLDSAEDITFPANPELVAKLSSELNTTSDLPLIINDQVAGYINVFAQSNSFRAHMAASLQRVGKYRGLIQRVLKEEGVPQDLIYLAVAESGFQPRVVNTKSGAGGMWQFMTYTAPEYGLTRNGYFDYRFDPEKSSRAYAQYIKRLHNMFGDWYLAMAAYDWGPGYIQRAVQRTGYADFWELYRRGAMPAETRAYVPQILAAIIMAKNPEKYGLNKLVPSPPVIYDTVNTSYSISLQLVADLTNSSVEELAILNPALLRLSTPQDISFDLHIPPGTKDIYQARLKDIPAQDRASWRFHVVKPGETLEDIATILHTHAMDIAQVNEVSSTNPIKPGDELVVPIVNIRSSVGQSRYTLRRGDTLVTVADRFGVSVEELRTWNQLSSGRIAPGRTLYVAEPVRIAPSERSRGRRAAASTARTSLRRGSVASSSRGRSTRGASVPGRSSARAASRTPSRGASHAPSRGASMHSAAPSSSHKSRR